MQVPSGSSPPSRALATSLSVDPATEDWSLPTISASLTPRPFQLLCALLLIGSVLVHVLLTSCDEIRLLKVVFILDLKGSGADQLLNEGCAH